MDLAHVVARTTIRNGNFRPLTDHPDAIRLLKVSGYDDSTGYITCTTHECVLQSPGVTPFVALSHVWGTERETLRILLNSQPHWVRPNLWSFLDYVAKSTDGPGLELCRNFLWIHALCIDQIGGEKSRQVPLMGKIFSEAEKVVGWLISPFSFAPRQDDPNVKGAALLAKTLASEGSISENSVASISQEDAGYLKATFDRLIEHPYWSRLWIVQELALARHVELLWEGQVIPWHTLYRALSRLIQLSQSCTIPEEIPYFASVYSTNLDKAMHKISIDFPIFDFLQPSHSDEREGSNSNRLAGGNLARSIPSPNPTIQSKPLQQLVKQYRNHYCSIPHDHVYALLAMADDAQYLRVEVSC